MAICQINIAPILVQVMAWSLQWCHKESDGISNHRCLNWLLTCSFRLRSRKTSKLRITGCCEGNPPETIGFPSQRASNTENVPTWWHHHGCEQLTQFTDMYIYIYHNSYVYQKHVFISIIFTDLIDFNNFHTHLVRFKTKLSICISTFTNGILAASLFIESECFMS